MKFKAEIKKTFDGPDKLRAIASVILDDCFIIKGVRVVDGEKGMFISLRNVKGEFNEQCFPLSKELRMELTDTVLRAYEAELAGTGQTPPAA